MNLFEHLAPWVAGFLAAEISAYEVRVGERPALHPSAVSFGLGGLGMVSGGVVFRGLSKLLHQEDALGVPCLDTAMVALRRRGLAGGCGKAWPVASISPYGLLHRTSGWQALMLSRWWVADARVERMGARPNRAVVVKTALTCEFLISK